MALKQIWTNMPRTRWPWVCTRKWPSSVHNKTNSNYFSSVTTDTWTLPSQRNIWGKRAGGKSGSRFRKKASCWEALSFLPHVLHIVQCHKGAHEEKWRSHSKLWTVEAAPQWVTQSSKASSWCKHVSAKTVPVFPWKSWLTSVEMVCKQALKHCFYNTIKQCSSLRVG